jgi:hypothetical protein
MHPITFGVRSHTCCRSTVRLCIHGSIWDSFKRLQSHNSLTASPLALTLFKHATHVSSTFSEAQFLLPDTIVSGTVILVHTHNNTLIYEAKRWWPPLPPSSLFLRAVPFHWHVAYGTVRCGYYETWRSQRSVCTCYVI